MARKKRRQRYRVREVVIYEVMAHSAEEAEQMITDDGERDKLCVGVAEREADLAKGNLWLK